ncbi:MAG: DNA polymerase IV [Ilumatobacteraceae bacterium]
MVRGSRVPIGEATILHADLDSFYASVEQRDDPALRGRPVAVGGGVVLAASYEAKRFGVRTAMNGGEARRLCPNLIEVPARFDAYTEASKAVFAIFDDTTPLVEGISIDEAFLDVGGLLRLAGAPPEVAGRLRARVAAEVGLPITVGVARTKFLAKVASGVGKPDGLLVVDPDAELDFLHPLPVERLWGVGQVTAGKLNDRGIHTVGEVARMSQPALVAIVGTGSGRQLHALAHNLDPRRVETGRRRGSIGSQQALGRRLRSRDELDVVLRRLVDRITRRMRKAKRVGRTVTLRFRFEDFSRATRAHTVADHTSATAVVFSVARSLLDTAWPMIEERGITLLGVSVGNLANEGAVQLTLPFERSEADRLDSAVDAVRDKFGGRALNRAATMTGDPGFTVPMLPD